MFELFIMPDNLILAIIFFKNTFLFIRILVILVKISKFKRLILIRHTSQLFRFSLVVLAELINLPYQLRKLIINYFFGCI